MLTNDDKQTIREIMREELDRVENKIDQVLKIVTDTQIKKRLSIPSPSSSAFA